VLQIELEHACAALDAMQTREGDAPRAEITAANADDDAANGDDDSDAPADATRLARSLQRIADPGWRVVLWLLVVSVAVAVWRVVR
jgi:hypothetical protein